MYYFAELSILFFNVRKCYKFVKNFVAFAHSLQLFRKPRGLWRKYLSMALQPFVGPWPLFRFLILYTVGRTPWTRDQLVARPLPKRRTTQTQIPWVGFEPTTPVFERVKTVHASDRAATVIGMWMKYTEQKFRSFVSTLLPKHISLRWIFSDLR
jgi:hypothetical protein